MASIKRHASAAWSGSGKDGKGSLTTQKRHAEGYAVTASTLVSAMEKAPTRRS